jgi:hypothetical protein
MLGPTGLLGLVIFLAALALSSGLIAIFRPRRAAATATGAAAVVAISDWDVLHRLRIIRGAD